MTLTADTTTASTPTTWDRHDRTRGQVLLIGTAAAVVAVTAYGFCVTTNPPSGLSGWLVWTGQIAGISAALLSLFGIMLAARIPVVENTIGHIQALTWHKQIGKATLIALLVHIMTLIAGYTPGSGQTPVGTGFGIITETPWMMQATLAALLFAVAGITSYRAARARLTYERWWALHLYFYLAVSLGFAHQIVDGPMFADHPLYRGWWIWLYLAVAASVIGWRIIRPLWWSVTSGLRVDRVVEEADGIVSVYVTGITLNRFAAQGGQFFRWRFLSGRLGWHALPLSLSETPNGHEWRITVSVCGNHTRMLAQVQPGTRIIAEGPYGKFTADQTRNDEVVAFVAGVGAAPVRSLAADLPDHTWLHVVHRASSGEQVLFAHEWEQLAADNRLTITLTPLIGSRAQWTTRQIINQADIGGNTDVFICAPDTLVADLNAELRRQGVPSQHIHTEVFNL